MRKFGYLVLLFLVVVLFYFLSALYSLHQFHKAVYFNDVKLIETYVEWDRVKYNLKQDLEGVLSTSASHDEQSDIQGFGGLLASMFTRTLISSAIDKYVTPVAFSELLTHSPKTQSIPVPNYGTFAKGIAVFKYISLEKFAVKLETRETHFLLIFEREGLIWKLVKVDFADGFKALSEDLLTNFDGVFSGKNTSEDLIEIKPQKKRPLKRLKQLKGWALKLGLFSIEKNADRLTQRVIKNGWSGRVIKEKELFAVYVGPFNSEETANQIQDEVKIRLGLSGALMYID